MRWRRGRGTAWAAAGAAAALLVAAALCAPGAEAARGSRKEKDKKKAHRGAHDAAAAPPQPNLCDIQETGVNAYCYCNSQETDNATEATCWIFNGEKGAEDPAWSYFSSQSALERLKLSVRPDGRLRALPSRALAQLPRLRALDVMYGALGELPTFALANLSHLNEVSLSRNQISALAPRALARLPQLEQLNLDENRLSELRRDCLQLPQLRRLFLARNNLSLVQERALSQLPRLEELELNVNQISVVTRETFAGLKSLKRLDLESNRLSVLGERTFAEMPNLEELVLDENELQLVDPRALWGLGRLKRLSLADNRLRALPSDVLMPTPRLRALDLRDNSLASLPAAAARPLLPALRGVASEGDSIQHAALHLDGNNFLCDCRLTWMYTLRNETTNEQVRNALEELTCILTDQLLYLDGSSTLSSDDVGTEEPDFVRDAPVAVGNTVSEEEYDEGDDSGSPSPAEPRKHLFDIPPNLLPCPEELSGSKHGTSRPNMVEDYEFGLELNAKMSAASTLPMFTAAILCVPVAALMSLGT